MGNRERPFIDSFCQKALAAQEIESAPLQTLENIYVRLRAGWAEEILRQRRILGSIVSAKTSLSGRHAKDFLGPSGLPRRNQYVYVVADCARQAFVVAQHKEINSGLFPGLKGNRDEPTDFLFGQSPCSPDIGLSERK
jgi:hypothetical protein